MTHPEKLSDWLKEITAERQQTERNQQEAERVGAYREFSDDDDRRGVIGDEMAEWLLPKTSQHTREELFLKKQIERENAETAANYRKLMSHGQ